MSFGVLFWNIGNFGKNAAQLVFLEYGRVSFSTNRLTSASSISELEPSDATAIVVSFGINTSFMAAQTESSQRTLVYISAPTLGGVSSEACGTVALERSNCVQTFLISLITSIRLAFVKIWKKCRN